MSPKSHPKAAKLSQRSTDGAPRRPAARQVRWRTFVVLLVAALLLLAADDYYQHTASDAAIATAPVSELRLRMRRHPRDIRLPLELCRRYLLEQRFPEAARELNRVQHLAPQSPDALYLRGLLNYFEHDEVAAIENFEQALKFEPGYHAARLRLGIIYVERNELKKALDSLKEYAGEEPFDDAGYYWLGVVAFNSGYEKLGFWAVQRALELAPDVATYHLALGGFYLSSRQSKDLLDKAELELREATRLAPGDWMMHYRLAVACLRRNRLQEGAAELEEAARLNPRADEPCFLLPQIFRQLGDPQKAAHYQRIAESRARAAATRRPQAQSPTPTPGPRRPP